MPTLVVVNFNIVCATLGGFVSVFGLVSYLLKEKFYLSEALISLVAGLIFSPHATNLIKPLDYANGSATDLGTITLYFTRLVLGVQLVLAGVQLPSRYLRKEWRSLALLLGPGMTAMWVATSLLVWSLVPGLPVLHALAIGACVTPTDPVLSNSIVKGKFADKNVPKELQKIIIAESGANDGLGYPFLFLPLYLIRYFGDGGAGQTGGARTVIGEWFGEIWAYTILLSMVYGATVGWIAKELLHWAEQRRYVDRESFLVFAITLALFIVGTVGMIGSDDVLACFIAGNTFTWDDWFRLETLDDSLQPTIDMLLNVAVFMWFGAICPWYQFAHNNVIPIYRLIPLGVLVLLLRRLPVVMAMHKKIKQIEEVRQALFVGFFGPIGVSAIFYLYISLDYLRDIQVDGTQREDVAKLSDVMMVVVWFMAICSIIVHGLSIPLGKLGIYLPRTISNAVSTDVPTPEEPEAPFRPHDVAASTEHILVGIFGPQRRSPPRRRLSFNTGSDSPKKHLFGIPTPALAHGQRREGSGIRDMTISGPSNVRRIGRPLTPRSQAVSPTDAGSPLESRSSTRYAQPALRSPSPSQPERENSAEEAGPPLAPPARTIKFGDENAGTATRETRDGRSTA